MTTLDLTVALNAIAQQANNNKVTPVDVKQLLNNVKGATMANFTTVTDVKLSAANKDIVIKKVSVASIQLFNSIKDFNKIYKEAVKRSAIKLGISSKINIEEFQPSDTYFEHTDCFSLCKHKLKDEYYLYALYNSSKSVYVMDGKIVDKQTVASYMTPSAAKELLNPTPVTHNVTNDVVHDVVIRTLKLSNIVRIAADKQVILV